MVSQGDIILLNFDPQVGHEQCGVRPALVVSNNQFHKYFKNRSVVCPITNTNREWKTHLKLPNTISTTGVVMCEQLKFVDVESRGYKLIEKVPDCFLIDVLNIINMLF